MSVIFSRHCEYALQAVSYLALKSNGEMTSIRELAKDLDIPYHFLGKILQDLTYKGILASQKGPTGGFRLATDATTITLFQIVEAIDGLGFTDQCVLGFAECSSVTPCAVHEKWSGLRENIRSMLAGKGIDQVAAEMRKPQYRRK